MRQDSRDDPMPGARTDIRRARAARIAGLYALTPDLDDTGRLLAKVAAALDGGAAAIQYRNKAASVATRRAQAHALAQLCAGRDGLFIVNDDVDLAVEVGADGVHLGEDDDRITAARERLGPHRLVGVSCYGEWQRAQTAVAEGADYVAFGSFFPSATKPDARRADISLLRRAHALGVPAVAIGGITAANAPALIAAGASAVAVIADVFTHGDAADVTRAASALASLFAGASAARRGRPDRSPGHRRETPR
jgi:thiamine-phosphate pyrophosphorylase